MNSNPFLKPIFDEKWWICNKRLRSFGKKWTKLSIKWLRIHQTKHLGFRIGLALFGQCALLRNSGSMEISNGYTSQASHQMFMNVLPSKLYVSVKNSELLKWCWIFSGIEFPFWALNTKGPCYVVANKISFLLFYKFHCLLPCLMLE